MIIQIPRLFKQVRRIATISMLMLTVAWSHPVDINNASLTELQDLPLNDVQTEALYEYVQYHGPLESIYELVNIPELDHNDIEALKTRLILKADENASTNTRLQDQYRKVEAWMR